MTPTPIQTPWAEVMAGLTGARLAVYDELARLGTMDFSRLQERLARARDLLGAVNWLEQHRLIVGYEGTWSARGVKQAAEVFAEHGPAPVAEPTTKAAPAASAPSAPRPGVHVQNVSWFD